MAVNVEVNEVNLPNNSYKKNQMNVFDIHCSDLYYLHHNYNVGATAQKPGFVLK